MRSNLQTIGAAFLAVVTILVVGTLLYLGIWWLRGDTTDRRNEIQERSYGRQSALVQQILDDLVEVEDPNLPPAQRTAIYDQVCDSYGRLTDVMVLPANARNTLAKECR